MVNETKNLFLNNSFVPQQLRKKKLYSANLVFAQKNEVYLEFDAFNYGQSFSSLDLLKMPENYYAKYGKTPFFPFFPYSFYLNSFNQGSQSFQFGIKQRKLSQLASLKQGYFFKKEKSFQRGRFLSTSVLKYSINKNLIKLNRKRKKRKIRLKKFIRFFLSLSSCGFLKILNPYFLKIVHQKTSKKKGRLNYFIKKNNFFRSSLCLMKHKKHLFCSLVL